MKRNMTVLWYWFVLALGLLWVFGCSSSPTGGGTVSFYRLDIFVQPTSVWADTGKGIVYCFLTHGDTLAEGYPIQFRAVSEDNSNSNITSTSFTSDTAATGTVPTVYYNPNNYQGDVDTIYAILTDIAQDTVAWDSVIVPILRQ